MAALYRKYRSPTFDEIVGQENVVDILKNQLKSGSLPHALLFIGPRGTGKTSLARIIAKSLNCLHRRDDANPDGTCENCKAISDGIFEDLIEIDAASNRGIEEIRTIKENVNLLPIRSQYKIYIIDEAHMLTREAFNALLKVLEEPPKHIIFIMCTTEASKILPTIVSRCEKLELSLAATDVLMSKLKYICEKEGFEADENGLKVLTELAAGSFRDSESLLEKVLSSMPEGSKKISEEDIRRLLGMPSGEIVDKIISALKEKQTLEILKALDNTSGISPTDFIKLLIAELSKDFVKNNELLKFILKVDQDLKYTQYGFILIKSRFVEWCNTEVVVQQSQVLQVVSDPGITATYEKKPEPKPVTPEAPKPEPQLDESIKSSIGKTDFVFAWKNVVEGVGIKNKPLKFILNAVKAENSGNNLTLKVGMKLHKDLLEKKTAKDLITEFYERYLKEKPIITIVLDDGKTKVEEKPKDEPKQKEEKKDVDLDKLFNS